MKLNKLNLICILIFFSFTALAKDLDCDVLKSRASQANNVRSIHGNAVAVEENLVVINDHSLGDQDAIVVLTNSMGESFRGKVIHRDFHTDLAFVEVEKKLKPCGLADASENRPAEVAGFDKEDSRPSVYVVNIKNTQSQGLSVPGVKSGVEITGSSFRQSQSGSALMQDRRMVGILSQMDRSGAGLVIPSNQIRDLLKGVKQGSPPVRSYSVDRRNNLIKFQGLQFKVEDQKSAIEKPTGNQPTGGNPHEGKTLPELDHKKPISLETLDVGFAVARIDDLETLRKFQPELAAIFRHTNVTRVYVRSVGGREVRSLLEFLRLVGDCRNKENCKIDGFWIETKTSNLSLDDRHLNKIKILGELWDQLQIAFGNEFALGLYAEFQDLNVILTQEYRLGLAGISDQNLSQKRDKLWSLLSAKIDKVIVKLSDEGFDSYLNLESVIRMN